MLIIKEKYLNYKKSFSSLQELSQDEVLERSLRVFDLRFRLANDMIIDYTGEISKTKTSEVKESYIEIFKLLEFWNTYEALLKYVKYVTKSTNKLSPYMKLKGLLDEDIENKLKSNLNKLEEIYKSAKEDIDGYLTRIIDNDDIRDTLKNNTKKIKEFLEHKIKLNDISGYELLGLIYAERNMYDHNGEAAKMGMKYKNRLDILKFYKSFFPDFIIDVATFMINKEIEQLK